jgi:D-alanyl-D-alanine carboxypeptidase (penicillin-binding protein 5/6)
MDAEPVRLAESGATVGQLVFTVGEREIPVPLALDATIDDPGPWWRLSNPEKLF